MRRGYAGRRITHGGARRPGVRTRALTSALGLLALACAPMQSVWLDLGPDRPVLFVDGVEWSETPEMLELRADRDHTLFFKQPGHRPQLVVVESVEGDGGPELRPDSLRVRLLPLADGGTEVEVELDGPSAESSRPID